LNTEKQQEIKNFLVEENIVHLADLPYDENFTKAMVNGMTIVEYDQSELKNKLSQTWEKIKTIL
jgi:MinD superfamily P-loop ATPase